MGSVTSAYIDATLYGLKIIDALSESPALFSDVGGANHLNFTSGYNIHSLFSSLISFYICSLSSSLRFSDVSLF